MAGAEAAGAMVMMPAWAVTELTTSINSSLSRGPMTAGTPREARCVAIREALVLLPWESQSIQATARRPGMVALVLKSPIARRMELRKETPRVS